MATSNPTTGDNQDILSSYIRIRNIIGLLGIILPILIYFVHGGFLASISHYYYSKASLFFTGILAALGLFLISYKGYKKADGEMMGDGWITNIGGVGALLVVIIPTACSESMNASIEAACMASSHPLLGHNNGIWNFIHLASAAIFFISMGYISIFRFTKGTPSRIKTIENKIYRFSGYMVWASILFLFLKMIFHFSLTNIDVFIFETIAVTFFGISWLVKGNSLKQMMTVLRMDKVLEEEIPQV